MGSKIFQNEIFLYVVQNTVYVRWIKISPSPAIFVLHKNFEEKPFFSQCRKGQHIHVLYAIFNAGQNFAG